MSINVSNLVKSGIPNLTTYREVSQLCSRVMIELQEQALNGWVFTRYVRLADTRFCNSHVKGVTLDRRTSHQQRVAVGIAVFDPDDASAVYVGGAAMNPVDRWNRHLGRVVAALRMVRVPVPLAALWSIEKAPWDHHSVNSPKKLFRHKWRYPWSCLRNAYMPTLSRPAVVDVARQAIRHRLWGPAPFTVSVQAWEELSIEVPDMMLVNTELATQLVDKACGLPMSLPLTAEDRAVRERNSRAIGKTLAGSV